MTPTTQTLAAGPELSPLCFLPAQRASREEVLRQHAMISRDPLIRGLLDSSLSLTMILNAQRQAVFINEAFRARLGLGDGADAVGSRLGEYLECRRAGSAPAGCGTTPACRDCGAARAIAGALEGRAAVEPCRVQTVFCGRDLCLTLSAAPLDYGGERFLLVSALDASGDVRRRELEQVFFHDVLNTASGVQGLIHFMQDCDRESAVDSVLPIARRASDTLIDELLCQRDLVTAEHGALKVSPEAIPTRAFLTQLTGMLAAHPLAKGRSIAVAPGSEDLSLTTDKTLLSRVLLNLMKNAIEAVRPAEAVTVSCRREDDAVVFLVHNPGVMPPEVQHQVFERSYSTKGAGRGLGTYSVRLLTENYLGGAATFTSDAAGGTTFRVRLPLAPAPRAE